jgi:hypothetical protein
MLEHMDMNYLEPYRRISDAILNVIKRPLNPETLELCRW